MANSVHAGPPRASWLKPIATVMTAALLASGTPLPTLMVSAAQGGAGMGGVCWGGCPGLPRSAHAHTPLGGMHYHQLG